MMGRGLYGIVVGCLFCCVGCSENFGDSAAWLGKGKQRDIAKDTAKEATPPKIKPMTFVAAGRVLERQDNNDGARAQYEKAIVADARFVPAYNRLGMLYQRLGRLQDAERIFKTGIEAVPGSAALHNNLGYTYLSQRRYAEAKRAFSQALVHAPEFKRARMNLGITLARMGKFGDSVREFSRVVPAGVAYYNVGVVCLDDRDYVNAEKAFEEALAVDADCPGVREQLERSRYLAARSGTGNAEGGDGSFPVAGDAQQAENVGP